MKERIMKLRFLLILTIQISLGTNIYAQSSQQDDTKYKAGVADYRQQRYAAAMEKLSPLTAAGVTSVLAPYAHYYYALSAYQLKKYRESKQMLAQLVSRYPAWNKINDVYYLLGANNLATGQHKEAIEYLLKVKDSSLADDVQNLKQYHLAQIKDRTKLVQLQKQFPADRDVAIILIQFIESSPSSTKTDLMYAEQLENQFKVTSKEKVAAELPGRNNPKQGNQWTKGYLEVAVLLPFRLDEFATSKKRTNQFAYDYYIGLTMAREKLKTEGINVNLWAYDIANDPRPMKDVVENQSFQKSDLIIGPLYAGTFDITADYVSSGNRVMLNPLSTDASLLKNGSNIYLAHPSIPFQMQKAAQWMKSVSPGAPAAIYYGNTSKDSAMAFSYAEEWKSKGGKVIEMLKIRSEREWLEGKLSINETVRPSHMALFSSDVTTGTMLIELVNGRKLNTVPLLATSTSFNLQQSRLSRYASRLYLIETDYVDKEKEGVREFQRNYWNLTNTFPSVYSYQGYDQLLFFGRMMSKYKDDLAKGLEMRKYTDEDYLLSGFDFTKARDNRISPVLRYSGSKWIPVQ
jgi:ABC-type branched-subunit amino acid transport system substrate-binding protein